MAHVNQPSWDSRSRREAREASALPLAVAFALTVALALLGAGASDGSGSGTATSAGAGAGTGGADSDAPRPFELVTPIEVKTKTASGHAVKGKVERWDAETFAGTFGTRRWDEFAAPELNRVFRMLMDEKSAVQWITLGERLLEQSNGEKMAETAFGRAKRLDKASAPEIDAARGRAAERRRMLAEQRLQDILPDGDLGSKPWPIMSDEEQKEAVAEMKKDAERMMRDAGTRLSLVETKYFLLYSELSAQETSRWAGQLDGMYEMVMQLFQVEPGINLFWGKAVVFIFPNRERFRLVQASAFGSRVPDGVVGLCNIKGPKVFVNSYRDSDELQFTAVLLHETTHGIMHRYLTPAKLPEWANEGFAERIAHMAMQRVNLRSPVDKSRRGQGVNYIRNRGDLALVMRMNYQDGSWPGENAIGYAVGYVLCNFMLDVVPRVAPKRGKDRFKDWVIAVKGGKPWEKALAEDFGFPVETIAAEAVKWYRTND